MCHVFVRSDKLSVVCVSGVLAIIGQCPVDAVTDVCNSNSIPEDNSILEIWRLSRFLGVDSDEVQVLPQNLDQVLQVELHVAGDDHIVGAPGKPVHLLQADLINLIVDIKAGHVDPGSRNDVNELIWSGVLPEKHLRVVYLVLVEDGADHLLIHVGQVTGCCKGDPSGLLLLEINIWFPDVEPDANSLQFSLKQVLMNVLLASIQDHDDQVRGPRHSNDLPPPTLAL